MPCYVSGLPYVSIKYMLTSGMANAVDQWTILIFVQGDRYKPGKHQYGYWFPQEFTSVFKQMCIKLGKFTLFLLRLKSSTYKQNIELYSLNLKYKQAPSKSIEIPNPHRSWQGQSIPAQKNIPISH